MSRLAIFFTLIMTTLTLASPGREVPYGSHPLQRLDVYPAPGEKNPVVVFVHGGGWRGGDKDNVRRNPNFVKSFHDAGWTLVAIDYRLMPSVTYREQCSDVAAGLAWVEDSITSFGGDPDRVALFGHSAGAHLVALTASDPDYLESVGLKSSWLRGVVCFDVNAYDIPRAISTAPSLGYSASSWRLPTFFSKNKDIQKDASPVHHLKSDVVRAPFLVVSALYQRSKSQQLSKDQSQYFAGQLKKAGTAAEFRHFQGSHGELVTGFGTSRHKPTKWLNEFLRKNF